MRNKKGENWRPEYSTRLKGYFPEKDSKFLLHEHDDIDCLNDLEKEGLVEIVSCKKLLVRMTEFGNVIVSRLREHKAKGGYFSNFYYSIPKNKST